MIKSCISKSCGFSQWKALFLENQNLLVTILQIHLPTQARAMTPLPGPVHSSFSRVSPLLQAHEIRYAWPAQVICWTRPTHDQLLHLLQLWWSLPYFACDCIHHSKGWLFSGVFPSRASRILQPQITKAAFTAQLSQKALQHFFLLEYSLGLFNKKGQK